MGPGGEGVKEGGRSGCEWYGIAAIEAAFGIRQRGTTIFRRFYKQYSCSYRVDDTAERKGQVLNQQLKKQTIIQPAANQPNNHSTSS